jgi:uncharacterized protein
MSGFSKFLFRFVKFGPWGLIPLSVFLLFLPGLSFDYALEKFLAPDDPMRETRDRHLQDFGSDYDFYVVTSTAPQGFDANNIDKIRALTDSLLASDYVQEAFSLTSVKELYLVGDFPNYRPLIRSSEKIEADSARIFQTGEWVRDLVSSDGRTMAVVVRTDDGLSKEKSDILLARTRNLIESLKILAPRIIGKIRAQETYVNLIVNQTAWFVGIGALLIWIFLTWFFRNPILPLVLLLASGFAVLVCLGLMALFGKKVDAMISGIPVIMLAIGMADLLHLQAAYRRVSEKYPKTGIAESLREAGLPALLTSITTAIGFFSLAWSNLPPVREFGFWAGVGVICTLCVCLCIHPIICRIPGRFGSTRWQKPFPLSPKLVWSLVLGITVLSVWGLTRVQTNIYLIEDLRESHPLKQDFSWFDTEMGGVRPLEMTVPVNFSDVTPEYLRSLEKIEAALIEHFESGPMRSILHLLRSYRRASYAGNPDFYALPASDSTLMRLWNKSLQAGLISGLKTYKLLNDSEDRLRFFGRMPDVGSLEFSRREAAFRGNSSIEATDLLSGTAGLVDRSLDHLARSLVTGLMVSVLAIGLIFLALERSLKTSLAAICVNALPILFLLGFMGIAGIYLRASNAIVFCMVLGIAADDSLHVLWRYRKGRRSGLNPSPAMFAALNQTRPALRATTAVLMLAFLPMLGSSFLGNFQMGWISAVGMLIALFLDVYFLPLLLTSGKRKD